MVSRALHLTALLTVFASSGFSQPAPAAVSFDVVSVKMNIDADTNEIIESKKKAIRPAYQEFRYTPGRVTCSLPLISIIREAYSIETWKISGPKWLYDGVYDLVATMPPGTPRETARLMLRTMLAERFALKFHWGNEEIPVYLLVVGKRGAKLAEASNVAKVQKSVQRGYFSGTTSMAAFAAWIYDNSDLPVVDKTGLQGNYDVELKWTPEFADLPGERFKDGGLFSAIEEQLGLKLNLSKSLMTVLAIDNVRKVPAEN